MGTMPIDLAYLNLCNQSLKSVNDAVGRSVNIIMPHRGRIATVPPADVLKALDQLVTAVSYLSTAVGHLAGGAEQELRKQ